MSFLDKVSFIDLVENLIEEAEKTWTWQTRIWKLERKLAMQLAYKSQVGFGRACTPVRCAHPSYWAY